VTPALSTKKLVALVVGIPLVVISVLISKGFLIEARRVIAFRFSNSIVLPVAARQPDNEPDGVTLTLRLRANGTILTDNTPIKNGSLDSLLEAEAPNKVIVLAEKDVPYENLKACLSLMSQRGIEKVVVRVIQPD